MANETIPPTNEIQSTRFPYDMVAWSTEKTTRLISALAASVDAINDAASLELTPEQQSKLEEVEYLYGRDVCEEMMPRSKFDHSMRQALFMAFTLYGFATGNPDFHPKCSFVLVEATLGGGSKMLAEEARRLGIDRLANALERDLKLA